MNILENKNENIVILAPEGRLDITNSGDLEKKLLSLIDIGEKQFILDFLSSFDYIRRENKFLHGVTNIGGH